MKLLCIKNYEPGWLGLDFRGVFEVGKTYTILQPHYRNYAYSDLKGEWINVYTADLIKMFKPEQE